jgi:hypothetical protein
MNSKRLLCLALGLIVGWLISVLPACGLSIEIPVTPSGLVQGQCAFSILTNAVEGGVFFHVTITTTNSDVISNSTAGLCIVTHWNHGGSQIMAAKPRIRVTLKQDDRMEKADFTVSSELLKNPDLCFVFTVYQYAITKDGKRIPIPSAIFYEIRLRDFLKP